MDCWELMRDLETVSNSSFVTELKHTTSEAIDEV